MLARPQIENSVERAIASALKGDYDKSTAALKAILSSNIDAFRADPELNHVAVKILYQISQNYENAEDYRMSLFFIEATKEFITSADYDTVLSKLAEGERMANYQDIFSESILDTLDVTPHDQSLVPIIVLMLVCMAVVVCVVVWWLTKDYKVSSKVSSEVISSLL